MPLGTIVQTCRTYHAWYESDFKIVNLLLFLLIFYR